jgi:FkbM family methyltransferase
MLASLFVERARKFGLGGALFRTARFGWNTGTRKLRQWFLHSYSQFGEDLLIDRLLGKPGTGVYVDVGANDPDFLNNTKRFYERGWRGVNIEPHVGLFRKFLTARPGDTNLNIGVGPVEGELEFFLFDPHQNSTFSAREAERYKSLGEKLVGVEKVKVETLRAVLERIGKRVDFLSVDAEGIDLEVLKSNDWSRFRPVLVCVESGDYETREEDMGIHAFMVSVGYEQVLFNGCNAIWRDATAAGGASNRKPG